ncbi:MAG: hypothetical protein HUU18_00785 [Phycisphaerales bacterium]|nr:hypothetical protein [Phycisphaerales bacterium]
MKTLFNALAVIAIANLLAVGGFIGWLKTTDRLDLERARKVREMFTPTLTAEKKAAEIEAKRIEDEKKKAEAEAKAARPPLTAQERLAARVEATELDLQRAERLRREVEDLQRRLVDGETKLAAERAAFEAERQAFSAATQRQRDLARDEQFQKTLGVIAGLKPTDAVKVLLATMSSPGAAPALPVLGGPAGVTGDATQGIAAQETRDLELAVEYLNAMDDRPRSKIITEIIKADEVLAAELLERLRLRGQLAREAKDPSR